ncbi:MAG TPA: alpha/beta fold hydrolase [Candidatus Nitrosotalea sp.]|nr:alpha/beta fold hydrolase [Candidatus Nitrosotalea sp.]
MPRTHSRGFVERAGVRLHYREWEAKESTAPPLFWLHGLSSNALFWERLAQRLPHRRIVALDQRSHGLSDRPDEGNEPAELVADAAHVIDQLGLGRPLVAGHSWGASIALELAATHPELACGLFFIDGPALPMSQFMSWDDVAVRMQPPFPVFADLLEANLHQKGYLDSAWDEDLERFVEAGMRPVEGGYASTLTSPVRLQMLKGMFTYQPQLLWGKVEGPLWVAHALQRPGVPAAAEEARRRASEELTRVRPDARVIWYDARHDIPLILPELMALDVERLAVCASWRELAARTAAVGGDLDRPVPGDAPGWSAHDLLAHLVSTQVAMVQITRSAGAEPRAASAPFDPDRWNAGQVARRRERTGDELKQELVAAELDLEQALAEADLNAPVNAGTQVGTPLGEAHQAMLQHQRDHLADLVAAVAPGPGPEQLS